MKVLITGGGGMLARAMNAPLLEAGHQPHSEARGSLDVTRPGALDAILDQLHPQWVLNFAALTRVDECESKRDEAFAVNASGAGMVAKSAAAYGASVLQVSTDYVFSGRGERPYREDDTTAPASVYGQSKLAGEENVRRAAPEGHLIVRTAWLYGEGGTNFLETILRKAGAGEALKVVDDQRGSPTWADDLAEALVRLIGIDARGTFHCTNRGDCTWFDLARAALEAEGLKARLDPTDTESLARPAPRPGYSVLDCTKFERATGTRMPDWSDAMTRYLKARRNTLANGRTKA